MARRTGRYRGLTASDRGSKGSIGRGVHCSQAAGGGRGTSCLRDDRSEGRVRYSGI